MSYGMRLGYQKNIITRCSQHVQNRDIINFIFWLDNISGQNKNWYLSIVLANEVNSEKSTVKTITLKSFEPGHTFMSADNFYH